MGFDRLEVIVAETSTGRGIESFVKWKPRSAQEPRISVMRGVFVWQKNLQLIHALKIPAERAGSALDFEGPVALVPLDYAADFQIPVSAVGKPNQSANVVLVGDVAQCSAYRWTTPNESFPVPNDLLYRTGEEKTHIDDVSEQVSGNS